MPLWQPGGPNGFSDESAAWTSPEGMKTRLQLAAQFAHQIKDAPAPLELVEDILGPNASRRDPRDGGARREPRAGLRAAAPVARISTEMTMSPFRSCPHLSRRGLLGAAGATFASASIPRWASAAAARDPRLVVVILRGALDGLSAVAPIGDPDYAELHRELALRWDGEHPALRLDDFFGLNPAMINFARLYDAKQAMIVHATATNYRERSHFDGQDVLESGRLAPGRTESGWLNRAVAALPKGERVGARRRAGGRLYRAARHARPRADPGLGALRPDAADRGSRCDA